MADQTAKTRDIIDREASPLNTKTIRSQKISIPSPTDPASAASVSYSRDIATESIPPVPRSHTPGHLASKSSTSRRKPSTSDLSIRQRAASAVTNNPPAPPPSSSQTSSPKGAPPVSARHGSARENGEQGADASHRPASSSGQDRDGSSGRRPPALRSTSAIAGKPASASGGTAVVSSSSTSANGTSSNSSTTKPTSTSSSTTTTTTTNTHTSTTVAAPHRSSAVRSTKRSSATAASASTYTPFPPLVSPNSGPDVAPAPSSGMYWSRALVSGRGHPSLRAHTSTIIGSNVYVFGGCDSRSCFNDLYVLDADAFHWSRPYVSGEIPVPLRAMTCTAVGKKLVIFGGGDGPAYYNDVYVLDTVNFRWTRPRIVGDRVPSKRRAHTACLYKNGIYVFGGGDGVRALNDVWRLDVSDLTKMSWKLISSPTEGNPTPSPGRTAVSGGTTTGIGSGKDLRPKARGYHTANIVDGKLIIFGGSDGGECFNDVWVYDIETHLWKAAPVSGAFRRLSHTATIVGSYLFVIGGHDGSEYSNDVLLLNLVQMTWDKRKVYGLPPSGRGYHGTVLHDSRLLTIGGFDGGEVFGDVWVLEMAVHAYYSQISHFQIDV